MGFPRVKSFLFGCASLHDGVAMIVISEIIFSMASFAVALTIILLLTAEDAQLFPKNSSWNDLVLASNVILSLQSIFQLLVDVVVLITLPKRTYKLLKPWTFVSYITILCIILTSTIDMVSYSFNELVLYGLLSLTVGAITIVLKFYFIIVVQSLLHQYKTNAAQVQVAYYPSFNN